MSADLFRILTLADTRATVRRAAADLLADVSESPAFDVDLLVAKITGRPAIDWLINHSESVTKKERDDLIPLLQRRMRGEPIALIVGAREFWGLSFEVTADTLVPRPDSETLIDAALARYEANPPRRILDLGTGSGCLLLSLLHEWPDAVGVGVDISAGALAAARRNADRLGLGPRTHFVQGSWYRALAGQAPDPVDLIISNPPYIASDEIADLMLDVRGFEPRGALDGGADGLNAYREILSGYRSVLMSGGTIILELGAGQANAVRALAAAVSLETVALKADLAGIPRAIVLSTR